MPRVCVVIPIHKPNLAWLREAIDSLAAQTLRDIEIVVVEDGAATFRDSRVRHLLNPQPGLGPALNYAMERCEAPLVARLDADDLAEPQRLEKQVAMFDADDDLAVAGSQLLVIGADGAPMATRRYPTAHEEIVAALQRYNAIAHPAVMFRREVILRAGGYPPTSAGEDYDLWCRLAAGGARFANHPQALTRYRFLTGMTQGNVRRAIRVTIEIKRRNFGPALTPRARLRLFGERLLLLLPSPMVSALFRMTQFRPLPRRAAPDDGRAP